MPCGGSQPKTPPQCTASEDFARCESPLHDLTPGIHAGLSAACGADLWASMPRRRSACDGARTIPVRRSVTGRSFVSHPQLSRSRILPWNWPGADVLYTQCRRDASVIRSTGVPVFMSELATAVPTISPGPTISPALWVPAWPAWHGWRLPRCATARSRGATPSPHGSRSLNGLWPRSRLLPGRAPFDEASCRE